ncbi:hypothetical protein E1B28_012779 [Marasmius oreades]|uniref:Uncharacterized protein n=1 Tax=Marasmius oreades TaxID=181124 RepID=A0A9P7RSY1_9AGAR|nr:uncharacterized protein E1B28_012779 [Marasmius oreades]KAG7088823.1 hypothetical protein E1B28_012779 [Marasmius oreades]
MQQRVHEDLIREEDTRRETVWGGSDGEAKETSSLGEAEEEMGTWGRIWGTTGSSQTQERERNTYGCPEFPTSTGYTGREYSDKLEFGRIFRSERGGGGRGSINDVAYLDVGEVGIGVLSKEDASYAIAKLIFWSI